MLSRLEERNRIGGIVRIRRLTGVDLFLHAGFNNTFELIVRERNSHAALVTATALGTIRSLEANIQRFGGRTIGLEFDIANATTRTDDLETQVHAHFESEGGHHQLMRRQSETEAKLDITRNLAPRQLDADANEECDRQSRQKPNQNQFTRIAVLLYGYENRRKIQSITGSAT